VLILLEQKDRIQQELEKVKDKLFALNQWMYENPELGFQEFRAVEKLTALLREEGFEVATGVAGKETAFIARFGAADAHPAIAVFAEYDALPTIGHACGHNIIATSAAGAAIAVKRAWDNLPGAIFVYGSPAEEMSSTVNDCGGKAYMVNAGLLDGIDVAMMFHPSNHDSAYSHNLAVQALDMIFHGKNAQPAGSAHEGINAFEAATLAYTCINACRQYFKPEHYVHGMISESGPAPNVISPRSVLKLHVRAPSNRELDELLDKIKRCGQAASLVTGASVEFDSSQPRYQEVVNNSVLAALLEENLRSLGRNPLPMPPKPRASTDMGNVSQVVPAVHGYISLGPKEQVGNTHSPEFAPATVSPSGTRALYDAALSMAWTIGELLSKPELVQAAKEEFNSWKASMSKTN
jgi:amidohydrolase